MTPNFLLEQSSGSWKSLKLKIVLIADTFCAFCYPHFIFNLLYIFFQDQNAGQKQDKKKKSTKLIELALEAQTHGFSMNNLNKYFDEECKMITNDRQEKERVDARNALEEFVYDIRGRIQEGGELYAYVTDLDRERISAELDRTETWLYEDGEDCERQLYKDRLATLQNEIEPIKNRHAEYDGQPPAFEHLAHSIQMARKAVDQFRSGDEKYDHLTETEILNVSEAADKAEKFYLDAKSKLGKLNPTIDPTVKIADINHEYDTLSTCFRSVLSRPKPAKPSSSPSSGGEAKQQNGSSDQKSAGDETNDTQQQPSSQEPEMNAKMDFE